MSEAVLRDIEAQGKRNLRDQLKAGCYSNAARDLETVAEWFHIEEDCAVKVEGGLIVRRSEIYRLEFDLTVGAEIKKTRPAIVIQNAIGNRYSSILVAAAITSKVSPELFPVEVLIGPAKSNGVTANFAIQFNQIRSAIVNVSFSGWSLLMASP